jgi:hypothetical protein
VEAFVGACKDPLGGHPLAIAILPIDTLEPTPFQRDLSDAHHKKLAGVIERTGTFLDPIITGTRARSRLLDAQRSAIGWKPMRRLGRESDYLHSSLPTGRLRGRSWR